MNPQPLCGGSQKPTLPQANKNLENRNMERSILYGSDYAEMIYIRFLVKNIENSYTNILATL